MSNRLSVPLRIAAVTAASTIAALSFAPAASAAEGDVEVVNTETVQVYTDATGAVKTKRVYEQVAMTGTGTVDLSNPIETDGLRNLDDFGGFDVEDGNQVTTVDVEGSERLRTVSDYSGDLPLEVEVQYFLDDNRVEPGDVVGADGKLEVRYTVRNVTSTQQEVTFTDGSGGEVTKTVDVPIPMVGSLSTVAPSNFTDVQSDQANIAGDGKGGTKLSFTMTLFPPLGSDTAEFGYTANISDGVVPRADISALPVNPLASPTFKTAADSYQGGASTGEELADGATQIDTNLLKLRDGAGDLLAGLIQLRDGSSELEAGLSGKAAPGSRELADGAGQLDAGVAKLDDGAGQLDDGANQLDDGLGRLNSGARRLAAGTSEAFTGSKDLTDGAKQLDGGLTQLGGGVDDLDAGANQLADGQKALAAGLKTLYDGVDTLPESVQEKLKTNADYQRLIGGLAQLVAGLGDKNTADSLVWGVDQVRSGLATEAVGGLDRLSAGANCASTVIGAVVNGKGASAPNDPANPCFPDGFPGLPAMDPLNPLDAGRAQVLNKVRAGLNDPSGVNPDPTLVEGIAQLKSGLTSQDPNDPGAIAALTTIECALDSSSLGATCAAVRPGKVGVVQGLQQVSAGVPQLVNALTLSISEELKAGIGEPTKGCDPEATLRCAAAALADGGTQLTDGIDQLVAGVVQLSAGGQLLAAGAGDLSDGLGQIDNGAGQLADGTGEAKAGTAKLAAGTGDLTDGTGQLKDGSGRLAAGAGELADGLQDAANGSTRLTDGLEQAADGAPQLVDGAQRLSDEGTKKLVDAGEDTAQNYGELFATIKAGSERAQSENMAYGAPEGAMGLTAYSFVIEGENGEGGRNLARGLTGLAILGAGAGAFAFRRGLI